MPPRKQPKTLEELSLKTVARLTSELCVNIERKHGDWKCQASRDELEIGKTYLSTIPHLFDDLWKVVLDMYFKLDESEMFEQGVNDKYLILELLMCDKLKTVDFSQLDDSNKCFSNSFFWKKQLLKLKNIVELDIVKVRLTDGSFQAIGNVCTNVRKLCITSDLNYASMQCLKEILKCRELRHVRIDFCEWEDVCIPKYVRRFLIGLPKLEYFHNLLDLDCYAAQSLINPVTSMRKLKAQMVEPLEFAEMIKWWPSLTDIALSSNIEICSVWMFERDSEKEVNTLKVLAESSLELKTLTISKFNFTKEITRVISLRCTHLRTLDITDCEGMRISVNDVYTIGVSCPGIVEFRFIESYRDPDERRLYVQSNCPNMEEPTFVTTPRMFVGLKVLELYSIIDWDQRIVPLILRHADNLTELSLKDVFKPSNNSLDPLSQILNANALQQLESLEIVAERYGSEVYTIPLPEAPIERLLDCCHKLTKLSFMCQMGDETVEYLTAQRSYMESENFDFTLDLIPVTWFD